MPRTVLFHCQHSLGLGHLVRALHLGRALARRFRVVLLSGGPPVEGLRPPEGVELRQLPPLEMGPGRELVASHGGVDPAPRLAARRVLLERALDETRPAAILVDLFPFGRKKLSPELLPWLRRARALHPRPAVISSVRDVLVTGRRDQAHHDARAARLLDELFDAVLVHGDPRVARLEDSFRPPDAPTIPVHYTGIVARARSPGAAAPARRGALVCAGGGRVGEALLRAALAAAPALARSAGEPLEVVAGPFLPDAAWRELRREAGSGVVLHRSVPDLAGRMARARVVVAQAGYNTCAELLATRTPGVLVPFAAPGEDEQTRRAARLAGLGFAELLEERALAPAALAGAVARALGTGPPPFWPDLGGAERTAAMVEVLVAGRALPEEAG